MPVKLNTTYISSALADKLSHISEYPVTSIVAPIGQIIAKRRNREL